jgi:hypothetical protein
MPFTSTLLLWLPRDDGNGHPPAVMYLSFKKFDCQFKEVRLSRSNVYPPTEVSGIPEVPGRGIFAPHL